MTDEIALFGLPPAAKVLLEKQGLPAMFHEFTAAHGLRHALLFSLNAPWFDGTVMAGTAPSDQIDDLAKLLVHYKPGEGQTVEDDLVVRWSNLKNLTPGQQVALNLSLAAFGKTGMTIRLAPRRYAVGLMFTTDEDEDSFDLHYSETISKGLAFGQAVQAMLLAAAGEQSNDKALTGEQVMYLTLLAQGLTIPEISNTYSMSEALLRRNLAKAQRKLEATSNAHAVAKAIWLGLIAA